MILTKWTKLPKGGGAGGGAAVRLQKLTRSFEGCSHGYRNLDVWPESQRKLWLELLAGSFKLIYKDAPPDGQHEAER